MTMARKKCRGLHVLRYIGDLVPERKRLSTDGPILLGREAISLEPEDVVDGLASVGAIARHGRSAPLC